MTTLPAIKLQTGPTPVPDLVDELAAHIKQFTALAYRDRETAQAISRIVADFVARYAEIDRRINEGIPHDEPPLAHDERALSWDLRVIRKWSPSR